MGKIVVTEFVSLDGVMEDPGGAEDYKHGGWTFQIERGSEGDQFKVDETTYFGMLLKRSANSPSRWGQASAKPS